VIVIGREVDQQHWFCIDVVNHRGETTFIPEVSYRQPTAGHTWSHAIGHESYEFLIDPRIGRGNGYYNRRQAFVFAGNYDLPFGRDKMVGSGVPGWLNQIIGGFQLNGTVTIDGGIPFTTNYANCSNDNDVGASDDACFLNKTGGRLTILLAVLPARLLLHGATSDAMRSGGPACGMSMLHWQRTSRSARVSDFNCSFRRSMLSTM
jgi:hypothetical protein